MQHFALVFFEITAIVITLAICLLLLAVLYMYIADVTQSRHTIRRNYPVLGRFRYLFEHLGEFFRQYLFAQDREEMPF
ncbi:MAG: FMN-binding glutamate synthase family protein, partial [Halieaceae bacterium]|nr:FMN-binding glutamate synthase family protein [Halieaceae bacterium]